MNLMLINVSRRKFRRAMRSPERDLPAPAASGVSRGKVLAQGGQRVQGSRRRRYPRCNGRCTEGFPEGERRKFCVRGFREGGFVVSCIEYKYQRHGEPVCLVAASGQAPTPRSGAAKVRGLTAKMRAKPIIALPVHAMTARG